MIQAILKSSEFSQATLNSFLVTVEFKKDDKSVVRELNITAEDYQNKEKFKAIIQDIATSLEHTWSMGEELQAKVGFDLLS